MRYKVYTAQYIYRGAFVWRHIALDRVWRSRTVLHPAPPSSQTKGRRAWVTSYARAIWSSRDGYTAGRRTVHVGPRSERLLPCAWRPAVRRRLSAFALARPRRRRTRDSTTTLSAGETQTASPAASSTARGRPRTPQWSSRSRPGPLDLALQDSPPSSSSILANEGGRRGGSGVVP